MRRLTLLLLSLVLALAVAGVRTPTASAQDNAAVAINTKDGSSIFKFAFSIRRVAGDVVDQTNAAVAYSQCEQCRAVAVAIQIVLVVGHPSVVTPGNLALAVNYQCTLCESVALAYQFVIGVPADFHFSAEALREMAQIRKEIRRLRKEDLPVAELRARIDALADRLRELIREDIRRQEERQKRRDERRPRPPPPPPPPTTTVPTETDMETFPTITEETTETAPTTTETVPTGTTTTTP